MTTWQIEPLGSWTRPVTNPRASSGRFRAGWQDTLDLLLAEIVHLQPAGAVALRVDVEHGAIRRDGMLKADARVNFPGVIVSFESRKHGPLTYATDAYEARYYSDLPSWQANIRAIALSLQALRAVDRYGVTKSGEQYVGWREIEAPARAAGSFANADAALVWIRQQVGENDSPLTLAQAYRALARRLHPDAGGDPAEWARLDQARQLLDAAGLLNRDQETT